MNSLSLCADALHYPYPGQMNKLKTEGGLSDDAPGKRSFDKFIRELEALSLSEQEELYTRTLDLSPLTAPYVGYQIWGESYKRGEFMARLSGEMRIFEIDMEGELPDHLIPVLRYLEVTPSPLPELMQVLVKSVKAMQKSLKKNEADNLYLNLFDAIANICETLPVDVKPIN